MYTLSLHDALPISRVCLRAASARFFARAGPAASSAADMAETAISSGSDATTWGSCQSIITEVSSRPRPSDIRVQLVIGVTPELVTVYSDTGRSEFLQRVPFHEAAPTGGVRPEFRYRLAVTGNHEALAFLHPIDDGGIVVAKLSLRNPLHVLHRSAFQAITGEPAASLLVVDRFNADSRPSTAGRRRPAPPLDP